MDRLFITFVPGNVGQEVGEAARKGTRRGWGGQEEEGGSCGQVCPHPHSQRDSSAVRVSCSPPKAAQGEGPPRPPHPPPHSDRRTLLMGEGCVLPPGLGESLGQCPAASATHPISSGCEPGPRRSWRG